MTLTNPNLSDIVVGMETPCTHPRSERITTTYPAAGYLNVPEGKRSVCIGCGTDFGKAD